jgi:hypothetical protein
LIRSFNTTTPPGGRVGGGESIARRQSIPGLAAGGRKYPANDLNAAALATRCWQSRRERRELLASRLTEIILHSFLF